MLSSYETETDSTDNAESLCTTPNMKKAHCQVDGSLLGCGAKSIRLYYEFVTMRERDQTVADFVRQQIIVIIFRINVNGKYTCIGRCHSPTDIGSSQKSGYFCDVSVDTLLPHEPDVPIYITTVFSTPSIATTMARFVPVDIMIEIGSFLANTMRGEMITDVAACEHSQQSGSWATDSRGSDTIVLNESIAIKW